MPHGPDQPDNPIDTDLARALAALRSAAPPTGMEDRILQNLDARLAEERTATFRSAWLRGALTGALAATAACAALFFTLRTPHSTVPQTNAGVPHSSRSISRDEWEEGTPPATPVALHTGDPCPGAPSVRGPALGGNANGWDEKSSSGVPHSTRSISRDAWDTRPPHLIPASFAPSHPAPPAPLTAQERALAELARKANPAMLAALSPAAQQKADAKRQADFDAFFAPSAEIRAVDEEQKKALGISDDEPAAPNSTKEGSL